MVFKTRCPRCSTDHVVAVAKIGGDVACPGCGKSYPVAQRAESVTEGLLASAVDELRRVREEAKGAAAEVAGLRTQITWLWLTLGAQTVLQLLVVTFLVGVLNRR